MWGNPKKLQTNEIMFQVLNNDCMGEVYMDKRIKK